MPYTNHPEQRFWKNVEKTDGCWLWTGNKNDKGYGRMGLNYKRVYAHRYSYELANGKIPEELEIDHTCENKSCVNPAHLEAVTHRENLLRSPSISTIERLKTRCPMGHYYDEGNTYRYDGKRSCKICSRSRAIKRYYKLKDCAICQSPR